MEFLQNFFRENFNLPKLYKEYVLNIVLAGGTGSAKC